MKEIRAEEYFSIGFGLGKKEYWTIFFNFLIYGILAICASITVVGIFIVPAIFVGFIKFTLKAARGEEVDIGDSLSVGFKNGMWNNRIYIFNSPWFISSHSMASRNLSTGGQGYASD